MFDSARFLPDEVFARITDLKMEARHDLRLSTPITGGRLNIVAADHPARHVTAVGDDPLRMADRRDFLARICRILHGGAADGVMAAVDVLEDLMVLDQLLNDAGDGSMLDGKVLIASLNRGGLAGSAWELDDPLTGPSPSELRKHGFDGGKLLMRVCPQRPESLKTITACAACLTEMHAAELPVFLEPLPVDETCKVIKEAGAIARLVGVAQALGPSTRRLWLKLPYCPDFETVARSTTLPILLLGGPAVGDAAPLLEQIAEGMAAGSNVRGALVGRNVLYPGDADPLAVARAVDGIVHRGLDVAQAVQLMTDLEGDPCASPWLKRSSSS